MPTGSNLPQPFRSAEPAFQQNPFERRAEGLSLEQYLQILIRRKWLLIAVVLTTVAAGAWRVFSLTPMFRAAATIQIDPPQNVVPYQQFDNAYEHMETQILRLQSRQFMERLEKEMGQPLPGVLEAERIADTLLLKVSHLGPDPKLAADVVNLGVKQFILLQADSRVDAASRTSGSLRELLQDLQVKVQQSEEALLRYARERGIVNISDRESLARGRIDGLTGQVNQVEGEIFALRSQIELLRRDPTAVPSDAKTVAFQSLETALRDQESRLEELSVRFGPEWPAIRETRQEIEKTRELMRAESAIVLQGLERKLQAAEGQRSLVSGQLGEQRRAIDAVNEDLIQYEILERESELNKELYAGLLQRFKEGDVAASLDTSGVQLVEEARVPTSPSFPNKTRALIQALVVGLALGLGAVILVEALDNSVKTSEDIVQRLGLTALGVIPLVEQESARRRSVWRRKSQTPGEDSPAMAFEGAGHGLAQEAYRSLRTSILLSHSGNPPRVVLVTSALPREGKSTTSLNIATSLAQTGSRTLLLDLDLRKASLDLQFGTGGEPGMTTYLSGNSDLSSQIRQTDFTNLFMVPAGPSAPNPAELIHSQRLRTGIQLLTDYFGYIVIDSPPCVGLSDALLLSPVADGVIVVARAGKTPRRALVKAVESLHSVGATVLGVLLNGVDIDQDAYGYYGKYTRRYGYYGDRSDQERRTA